MGVFGARAQDLAALATKVGAESSALIEHAHSVGAIAVRPTDFGGENYASAGRAYCDEVRTGLVEPLLRLADNADRVSADLKSTARGYDEVERDNFTAVTAAGQGSAR